MLWSNLYMVHIMMDIAYHSFKIDFHRTCFISGQGVWFLPTGRWVFLWISVKEEKIVNMALSKSVSDTIAEKVNANFGTRRLFRIIDFIQILFLRLNKQLLESIYNFLFWIFKFAAIGLLCENTSGGADFFFKLIKNVWSCCDDFLCVSFGNR